MVWAAAQPALVDAKEPKDDGSAHAHEAINVLLTRARV
jgi:hypothetical protein